MLLLALVIPTRKLSAVTQEIRYACSSAGEVYIVWGVNGWQPLPEKELPPGSFLKDKLIYTPMTEKGRGIFSVLLNVQSGAMIDYVFHITKGPLQKNADLWDTNSTGQKDYHTLAVSNTISLVESKIRVRPSESLSILDFAYALLCFSLLLSGILYFSKTLRQRFSLHMKPSLLIICSAASLFILLFLIRPTVMGISWDLVSDPLASIPQMIWAAFYDMLYVTVITVFFLGLAYLSRKHIRASRIICVLFILVCFVSLVSSILNIKMVGMLGKPFNYQWLYYSDFLKSADSMAAISANISTSEVARIAAVCLFAFLTGMLLLRLAGNILLKPLHRRAAIAACCAGLVFYSVLARNKLSAREWNYDRLANPVTAFLESVSPFASSPALFTMSVPDSLKFTVPGASPGSQSARGKIRNVIFFVMESTPAEYIEPYSAKYAVTPSLKQYEGQSVIFENIYAHAPATNLSMVSLLGSRYPWLSYNSLTQEHPDAKMTTISDVLKKKGYRTGFFNSADNRFQRAGEFLACRSFDVIRDCRDGNCGNNKYEVQDEKWSFMSGSDDACSAMELTDWIMKDTTQPFFCTMWTYQTHYPYFFSGDKISYEPGDSVLNRYLNALRYDDNVLGGIIERLKRNNLFGSTLIVVIGDHGEAFGRHGQVTHAGRIYEENLHIPCILINPGLASARKSNLGGMVDVAPTVMDLLGYAAPEEWQGRSLFAAKENERVFFFAPWSDYLFGYREGDYKYIYNASKNETEIYDLKKDPYEQENKVKKEGLATATCHYRIAGWAQYVNQASAR